jgi:hypothetical protein
MVLTQFALYVVMTSQGPAAPTLWPSSPTFATQQDCQTYQANLFDGRTAARLSCRDTSTVPLAK